MEYRGIEYAVRAAGKHAWVWTAYVPGKPPLAAQRNGPKEFADTAARAAIDRWLAKHPPEERGQQVKAGAMVE